MATKPTAVFLADYGVGETLIAEGEKAIERFLVYYEEAVSERNVNYYDGMSFTTKNNISYTLAFRSRQ